MEADLNGQDQDSYSNIMASMEQGCKMGKETGYLSNKVQGGICSGKLLSYCKYLLSKSSKSLKETSNVSREVAKELLGAASEKSRERRKYDNGVRSCKKL